MKFIESVRVDADDDREYIEGYGVRTRSRPTYRAEIVIRTDDREWIGRLLSYINGEADLGVADKRETLPETTLFLPQAPIDGVLEDK